MSNFFTKNSAKGSSTGKTSTILALTKELYGPELSKTRVLELNASDERGISIVREKVKNFARLTVSNPSSEDLEKYPCPPYKIIILDEADSMTADAQSALRRTMETYSGVTRFCLICNYITRIIDPLASRCSKFRFKPLDNNDALLRLQHIQQQENIRLEDGVLEEVLKIASGDLRKAITFLQSAARLHSRLKIGLEDEDGDLELDDQDSQEQITIKSIREIAGSVPKDVLDGILKISEEKNFQKIFKIVDDTISEGWSGVDIVNQLHDELILNDLYSSEQKNQFSQILFETDQRLSNGTDEHLQILNLITKISQVI
ncbi:Replication factor C subunit 2 [Wickerhamomyces ciferrii]|uniref:Replication factor C subunit 2 n=1 Tax=Wickerhamomyces ciferrii (strain ATCC 14091 / BCRC 22168 / CBS 111 / JCM 3599 / NBRC 0793 / NRRL Y-1031 F-60-10) TaxID=1206466 RepID=K0KIK6_WICCF|nr:Replication factor C subunit 2 [Wickerhamomyces ciferrii]CCH40993.1 Replication factor C subunit 2 [Wickerhamomyces ciferrii]